MALGSLATERRKELGAFYTPPTLVSALTDWAIRSSRDRVLEPAAGEAAFLIAALRRLRALGATNPGAQVVGVEIDREACSAAQAVLREEGESCEILCSDFFALRRGTFEKSDAVIGNPPYVRYHRFKGEARRLALDAATAAGVSLSGLTSSWAPFVVHASRFLNDRGRLAFVLPAELLHVDYAGPVRKFLLQHFGAITVVTFEEAVFPGAMIDTVLLLAERGLPKGLRMIRLTRSEDLRAGIDGEFTAPTASRWSALRVSAEGPLALEHLRKNGTLLPLGDIAAVDIGCVTGANDFFVLTSAEARRWNFDKRVLQPTVARPSQLRGAILTPADGTKLIEDEKCLLLKLTKAGLDEAEGPAGDYLRHGRRLRIHQRYKCRVRRPWYTVPGVRVPDAFLSYMSSRTPRLALNEAGFSSTNLVHQIRFKLSTGPRNRAYIAAMHSSISRLSFELEGRSYGGGVLKLETREAERVELPSLTSKLARELDHVLTAVDLALRAERPDEAAALVDAVLVRNGMLTERQLAALRSSHLELQRRRATRGRTNS